MNTSGSKTTTSFVFTQIIITGTDYQLKKNTVSYIILCYETSLPQCMICKLIHFDFCIILAIFVVYLV